MSAWLSPPVHLHSSREFECEDFSDEDCRYYRHRWRFWYEADHVYGLSTIAFFMSVVGVFIISYVISQAQTHRTPQGLSTWRRAIAAFRYLSYRGFYVRSLQWNSAPIGLLLLAAAAITYFFSMDLAPKPYYWPSLDWGNSPPLATRSGWMALACMPFIFATASKANWITLVTGVTHEKLQVFHRWISYAFFILALMHTFPFIVYHIQMRDMVDQVTKSNTLVYWTGIVGLVFQAWLTFASFSPLRNLGYEFFKMTHFFAVIVFILTFFWHCDFTLTSWDYFIATAAVYVPCLVYPWLRTCIEYGSGQTAHLLVEENDITCITIPGNFDWVPGQHCFLRFRNFGIHALTSHPFTICSLPSTSPDEPSSMTFYIRHRGGFTARLYNHALKQPGVAVPVFVDGPYGGIDLQKYYSSDHLLVLAGGSGAGWTLPFIEQFARCGLSGAKKEHEQRTEIDDEEKSRTNERTAQLNSARPLSLRVILATRDTATRVWFQKTVSHLLSKYSSLRSSLDLDLQVYLTGEAEGHSDLPEVFVDLERSDSSSPAENEASQKIGGTTREHGTNSSSDKELRGRPPLPLIIQEEAAKMAETGESLGVFVCGPDTMQNDVRNAVARENLGILKNPRSGGVYLHLEHFSWA